MVIGSQNNLSAARNLMNTTDRREEVEVGRIFYMMVRYLNCRIEARPLMSLMKLLLSKSNESVISIKPICAISTYYKKNSFLSLQRISNRT